MKKRIISMALCITLLLSAVCTAVYITANVVTDDYSYSSATQTYTVYTAAGLKTAADAINKGGSYNVSFGANIALSSMINIGTDSASPYSGTVDGCGYTLSGVTANAADTNYQAFIIYGGGVTVKNLTLDVNINAGAGKYVAGFLAENVSGAYFENCCVTGTLSGAGTVGGFIAENKGDATLKGCVSTADITSSGAYVGGLVAVSSGALSVDDCGVFSSNITSSGNYAGGVLGRLNSTSLKCTNAAVDAVISAPQHVGGILGGDGYSVTGTYPKITINNTVTSGQYSASTSYVGGFLGYNVNIDLSVSNSVSFADVSAPNYAGGYAAVLRGDVISFNNCVYAGKISCAGTYSSNVTGYVEVKDNAQTAVMNNCYIWGASKGAVVKQISIASGVTASLTVDGTAVAWADAKVSNLTSCGIKSRIDNNMKGLSERVKALAYAELDMNNEGTPGALAISEICPNPVSNGAYEYIEVVNTSSSAVKLDGYTIIRATSATAGNKNRSMLQKLMGTSSTLLVSSAVSLDIKNTGVTLQPNGVAVLWIASDVSKNETVDNFKSYWTSQGCDMSNVTVARVAQYDENGDRFPLSKVHSKIGSGFLADKYSASSIMLVSPENSVRRVSDESTLSAMKSAPTSDDMQMMINSSDSVAFYFAETSAPAGRVYNYYGFADKDSYRRALAAYLPSVVTEQKSTYPLEVFYPTLLTGATDLYGLPSMHNYIDEGDSVNYTPFYAGGEIGKPTPGGLSDGQFLNITVSNVSVLGGNTITVNGYAPNTRYEKVGFVVYVKNADGSLKTSYKTLITDAISADGTFTVTSNGFSLKTGDVIGVAPCFLKADGTTINGVHKFIVYPQKNVTFYNTTLDKIRVTYMESETGDYTGYYEAAKLLAENLEYYSGKEVTLAPFNEMAGYRQIVVGSPAALVKYIPSSMSIGADEYTVFGRYGNIYIVGDKAISAEYGAQSVIDYITSSTSSDVALIDVCSNTVKSFNISTNNMALTPGAELRIMTFNVERYELNTDLTRLPQFINTMKFYSSDIVGFQEYCSTFTAQLTPQIKAIGYTVLGNELSGSSQQNFTPLAYKTSRFTCVDKGFFKLSGENNYKGFNVTWAVLRDKMTGKMFAVTTTHFFHVSDRTVADPQRAINAQEILDFTKQIAKKYSCPVINMGDFNTYTSDVGYPVFLQGGVLRDARYSAERGLYMQRTTHADGSSAPSNGSQTLALDLFFVTKDVNVVRYKCPMNMTTASAADHFPTFVDVSLSSYADERIVPKPNSNLNVVEVNGNKIIKVPSNMDKESLLSAFAGEVEIHGDGNTGTYITRKVNSVLCDTAYIVVENDLTGDGETDIKDVIRAKKCMANPSLFPIHSLAADKNLDGVISSDELSSLLDLIK